MLTFDTACVFLKRNSFNKRNESLYRDRSFSVESLSSSAYTVKVGGTRKNAIKWLKIGKHSERCNVNVMVGTASRQHWQISD